MSIKVSDSKDAIRFLKYLITRTSEEMFDKMFKDLEMLEKERHYEQDCNVISFCWTTYGGKKPRRIITITVDDVCDNRIVVEPEFFYDPGMFSLRKPICFNIHFDEEAKRFKFEIFGGKWGPQLNSAALDPFNDPYELVRFDELMDLYRQLKILVGKVNCGLEFVKKIDTKDEAAKEADDKAAADKYYAETPYTEEE